MVPERLPPSTSLASWGRPGPCPFFDCCPLFLKRSRPCDERDDHFLPGPVARDLTGVAPPRGEAFHRAGQTLRTSAGGRATLLRRGGLKHELVPPTRTPAPAGPPDEGDVPFPKARIRLLPQAARKRLPVIEKAGGDRDSATGTPMRAPAPRETDRVSHTLHPRRCSSAGSAPRPRGGRVSAPGDLGAAATPLRACSDCRSIRNMNAATVSLPAQASRSGPPGIVAGTRQRTRASTRACRRAS